MSEDEISIRIKLKDAAKFAAELGVDREAVKAFGDEVERTNRKSKKSASGLDQLKKSAKGLGQFVKPALIIGGIGLMVQALNAGGAAAVGFLGALAPAAGLLAALPAGFLLAAQGAGVMKLAFSGVGGALGGLNGQLNPKKFAALSSEGQRFVLTLNSFKAPIRELQARVQNGLFPGLTKGLDRARPALRALLGPLGGTGGVLGGIGARLGGLIGSKGFSKDIGQQAAFNNVQLGRLGGTGLHVLDIFRQLVVGSRPLVSWLVRLTGGWSANADKAITADRANGKLAHGFQTIAHVTGQVFKILGNVGKAIFNIGNLGRKNLGESLLGSLVKGSRALDRWTESGPGIAKITGFFQAAKPVVYAFAELIGAAAKDFLSFGTGGSGGLTAFLTQVRTEMLPELLTLSHLVISIFGWVSQNIPGSSWIFTIGYALSKLGGGGLLSGIGQGLGKRIGATLASETEGEIKSQRGSFTSAGGFAGKAIGAAMGVGLLVELNNHKGQIDHWLAREFPNLPIIGNPFSKGANPINSGIPGALKKAEKSALAKAVEKKRSSEALFGTVPGPWAPAKEHVLVSPLPGGLGDSASHGPTLRAPAMIEVKPTGGGHGGDSAPTHIHTHVTLTLKDEPIAEGTSSVVARRKALD